MEAGILSTSYQDLTRDLVKGGIGADEAMFVLIVEYNIDVTWLSQRKGLQRRRSPSAGHDPPRQDRWRLDDKAKGRMKGRGAVPQCRFGCRRNRNPGETVG